MAIVNCSKCADSLQPLRCNVMWPCAKLIAHCVCLRRFHETASNRLNIVQICGDAHMMHSTFSMAIYRNIRAIYRYSDFQLNGMHFLCSHSMILATVLSTIMPKQGIRPIFQLFYSLLLVSAKKLVCVAVLVLGASHFLLKCLSRHHFLPCDCEEQHAKEIVGIRLFTLTHLVNEISFKTQF